MKSLDLTTLGQISIDFYGEQIGSTLKDMVSFKKYVGGTLANIAIGCSRLGLKCGVISSVSQDDMGLYIQESLKQENIDTSQLKLKSHTFTPLNLRCTQSKQIFPYLSYNDKSAFFNLTARECDATLIANSKAIVIEARNFLQESTLDLSQKALFAAKEILTKVVLVLDVHNIHTLDMFPAVLDNSLSLCDLIIGTEHDFQRATHLENTELALKYIRERTDALIVMKGKNGCYVFTHHIPSQWQNTLYPNKAKLEHYFEFDAFPAFISGFLTHWLQKQSLEKCCEMAFACSSLVQSRSDISSNLPTMKELLLYLAEQNKLVSQTLHSSHFAHIHYASTRRQQPLALNAFSFGYHHQWLKLGQTHCVDEEKVTQAKLLIGEALQAVSQDNPHFSLLMDDKAEPRFFEWYYQNHWVGRTIEIPNEIPLKINCEDISHQLLQWPKHHGIKVTLIYHPDDRYALRGQQEATLSTLYRACRATEHELLIELSPPANCLITASTYAHIMRRFYEIGVYPDWWQINPPRDLRAWEGMSKIIEEYDPLCRGVLVLGQQATFEQLSLMFNTNALQPYNKGFVVGKNIFQNSLVDWFAHKITDEDLKENVGQSFNKVVTLWNEAKHKAESTTKTTDIA